MFKKNYGCFIAGLPEVSLEDRKVTLTIDEFREQAQEYLDRQDLDLLNLFFLPNDNAQVLRLLQKQEPDQGLKTVYPLNELEEQLNEPSSLPTYLEEFINAYKEELLTQDVAYEDQLSLAYYNYLLSSKNSFVCKYASFTMNLRNVIAALNARRHGLGVDRAVVGDNEFAGILRQSNMKDFGLSMDYPFVEKIVSLFESNNLVDRERAIDLMIWDYIDEQVTFEYFSIEKVMSFMLKLLIVERWSKLDSESGREVFMELVERFREQFKFDASKEQA